MCDIVPLFKYEMLFLCDITQILNYFVVNKFLVCLGVFFLINCNNIVIN